MNLLYSAKMEIFMVKGVKVLLIHLAIRHVGKGVTVGYKNLSFDYITEYFLPRFGNIQPLQRITVFEVKKAFVVVV